jgi:hypothetical protein
MTKYLQKSGLHLRKFATRDRLLERSPARVGGFTAYSTGIGTGIQVLRNNLMGQLT